MVQENPNLTLEIYGEGDSLGVIGARAQELGLDGNLKLSGRYLPQVDVLEQVQSAHVGVIPNLASRLNRFALSSKMLEYVALGVPVVTADLPTIREHFSEDEVLFFPAGDARALANTLREVASDPEAAKVRAAAALRKYRECYGWSANAARYASVLERARSGSEPSGVSSAQATVPKVDPVSAHAGAVVFEASEDVLLFEHFRIPYHRVTPDESWFENLPDRHPLRSCAQIRIAGGGEPRALYWPLFADGTEASELALRVGQYRIGSFPMYCRLLPERAVAKWIRAAPGTWRPAEPIRDARGRQVSAVWRDDTGSAFLPFDPSEVIANYWSEEYRLTTTSRFGSRLIKQLGLRSYYLLRPAVPRTSQLRFRRMISKLQLRSPFPRWPIETALDDFCEMMFRFLVDLARAPVPWISPWPDPFSWALVLTHDVEDQGGYESVRVLRDLELRYGYRSSWNFVPMRYVVEEHVIRGLTEGGFEIGVHGLYHDGRDFGSHKLFRERLREISRYADRWGARGFRSPSTHRVWGWMSELRFDYDSSYPDTDPFEPFPGGCCSLLPYFNEDLVELPITLPQDHTLFMILGHLDGSLWVQKANYIKERGAMALLITHPDYIHEPRIPAAYETFLRAFENDATAWRALPADVSAWWRRRAGSRLEHVGGTWKVTGAAAGEARINFATNGSNAEAFNS